MAKDSVRFRIKAGMYIKKREKKTRIDIKAFMESSNPTIKPKCTVEDFNLITRGIPVEKEVIQACCNILKMPNSSIVRILSQEI